jgi:hypothetical protein
MCRAKTADVELSQIGRVEPFDPSLAKVDGLVFDQLPAMLWELGKECDFDTETQWLFSSLTQWAMLKKRLSDQNGRVPEATFDMDIVFPLHQILHRFDFQPQWREKKSQASSTVRPSSPHKKIDMMVVEGACKDELLFFESSLSTTARANSSEQDRIKLVHALTCSLDRIGHRMLALPWHKVTSPSWVCTCTRETTRFVSVPQL